MRDWDRAPHPAALQQLGAPVNPRKRPANKLQQRDQERPDGDRAQVEEQRAAQRDEHRAARHVYRLAARVVKDRHCARDHQTPGSSAAHWS